MEGSLGGVPGRGPWGGSSGMSLCLVSYACVGHHRFLWGALGNRGLGCLELVVHVRLAVASSCLSVGQSLCVHTMDEAACVVVAGALQSLRSAAWDSGLGQVVLPYFLSRSLLACVRALQVVRVELDLLVANKVFCVESLGWVPEYYAVVLRGPETSSLVALAKGVKADALPACARQLVEGCLRPARAVATVVGASAHGARAYLRVGEPTAQVMVERSLSTSKYRGAGAPRALVV